MHCEVGDGYQPLCGPVGPPCDGTVREGNSMRRFIRLSTLLVLAFALASCQDLDGIGVRNSCSVPFETRADTVTVYKAPWIPVPVGEGVGTVSVPEDWETLYVWVRAEGSAAPVHTIRVERSQATEPIDPTSKYDFEVVVSGPDCDALR